MGHQHPRNQQDQSSGLNVNKGDQTTLTANTRFDSQLPRRNCQTFSTGCKRKFKT